MIVVEHENIELDYSPDCGGVWFDAGELELLLDSLQLDQSTLSLDSILTAPEVASKEKKRKCPVCGRKMKKATVGHDSEVLIDACPRGDGLWFDKGEVGQVIQQVRTADGTNPRVRVITFLGEVFQAKD